jgi:hypothetical protein
MTMEQITIGDVEDAYGELIAALQEDIDDNPLIEAAFGDGGPPYDYWTSIITAYVMASPTSAQDIADALMRDVVGPLRSNAGEATYAESGGQTSQELSDPVQNIVDTVPDWTDDAGLAFKNVYLKGQNGLQNKLQYQYEFGVALSGVILAHQSVLLYARAGVIDILLDTAKALREAHEQRDQRRAAIGTALRDTLVETGVAALTGNWVGAATTAVKGVADIAITDLTWPDTDWPPDICSAMVGNFDTLHEELVERATLVSDAISALSEGLSGPNREHLLPPQTADPRRQTGGAERRRRSVLAR